MIIMIMGLHPYILSYNSALNGVGIDRTHQPQMYANHSTPLLNIIHISPFSTLVGMTALSRNEMTFAPPEKRLQKHLCLVHKSFEKGGN